MSIYKFYLQLFGEGGDAAPAGDNGSTGVTEQAAAAPEVPVYKKRQGDKPNVRSEHLLRYGERE